MSAEATEERTRKPVRQGTDPDRALGRLVDLINAESRRLTQKAREPVQFCEACHRELETLSRDERTFLVQAAKAMAQLAFGGRKLLAASLLQKLSDAQLEQLSEGMKGDWLPR